MTLRRLDQITQFADKRVLVRVDFNVPMQDGRITDDTRLQAALPTIRFIRERCAKVGLLAHFGRPNGKRVPSMSLGPLVGPLSALLEQPVVFANDCIGPDAKVAIDRSPKDIYVSKLPSDSPTTSMVRSSRPETEDSFRHCRSGSSLHSKGWKWRKRGAGASEEEA